MFAVNAWRPAPLLVINLLCCWLLVAPVSWAKEANPVRERLFDKAAVTAKGWSDSGGGRSWTEQDYQGYIDFLQQVAKDKKGLQVLQRWGIPHDCFDAIVALQWVYAFEHGLAINYGGNLNSVRYRNKPREFIFQLIRSVGTMNAQRVSYPVALNAKGALDSGLIYNYLGKPGHATYLLDLRGNGFFDRLEGPYPRQQSPLLRSLFFETAVHPKASLRRLYMFERKGNRVNKVVPKRYPADPQQSLAALTGKPLWQILQSRYTQGRDIPNSQVPWKAVFSELACSKVQQRIGKVNAGLKACGHADQPNLNLCTGEGIGQYSTPGFDKRFVEIRQFGQLIGEYLQPNMHCQAMNFSAGVEELEASWLTFQLTDAQSQLSEFFSLVDSRKQLADPKQSIPQRWGCEKTLVNCLGAASEALKDNILESDIRKALTIIQTPETVDFQLDKWANPEVALLVVEDEQGELLKMFELEGPARLNLPLERGDKFIRVFLADRFEQPIGDSLWLMH